MGCLPRSLAFRRSPPPSASARSGATSSPRIHNHSLHAPPHEARLRDLHRPRPRLQVRHRTRPRRVRLAGPRRPPAARTVTVTPGTGRPSTGGVGEAGRGGGSSLVRARRSHCRSARRTARRHITAAQPSSSSVTVTATAPVSAPAQASPTTGPFAPPAERWPTTRDRSLDPRARPSVPVGSRWAPRPLRSTELMFSSASIRRYSRSRCTGGGGGTHGGARRPWDELLVAAGALSAISRRPRAAG